MCVNLSFIAALVAMIITITAASPSSTSAISTNEHFSKSLENFGAKLYSKLAKKSNQQNIIFSPFSIETCLAMVRLGAEGVTAAELDQALTLQFTTDDNFANNFHKVLSTYENNNLLKIANKIYIMEEFQVQDKYNELLSQKFFTSAENLNFTQNVKAAQAINSWVATKTNNLIKNIITPNVVNEKTRMVLLNAIYFKGEWAHAFPEHATRQQNFYTDEANSVKVQMMHLKAEFRYGEISKLQATALEMPYKNSDLSMIIVLPNSRNGLGDLRSKLKTFSLKEIRESMYNTKVMVEMPKFKTEYEIELSEILQRLGMESMFTKDAEFGKILKSPELLEVSKVIHKAFIEVNEKGTEAAASTGIIGLGMTRPGPPEIIPEFIVDHGFFYMIVNGDGIVFFQGSQTHF
ncbi:antichymotrypsin-2-like [Musca autumnalis]|uniref:antichymotrypsin-2-like n=1 Tax=Musca autumnalis TaxID=221902 RepID=UPI003CEDE210